ncbi:MAG TPA: pitrilysin family protein, partial [Candidatus Eisenbacteria bacterium]
GELERAFDYPERVARVSVADVQAAARRYFGVSKATTVLYRPHGTPLVNDPAALEARLSAATRGVAGAAPMAAMSTAAFQVHRHRLPNGLTVLTESIPGLPIVAMTMQCRCGSGEETKGNNGITHLMQQLRLKGAGGRDARMLASEIESMGGHIRPFAGRDTSGVSMSVLRSRLDDLLPLFADVARRPDFGPDEIERERAKMLADLAAMRDSSLSFTMQAFNEALFAGHPYGLAPLGNVDSVPTLNRGDLLEWHVTHLAPERMVVAVVGDIADDEALERVERWFGDLPPGRPLGVVPEVDPTPVSRKVVLTKDVAQSVIVLGCPGPAHDSPERYALDVLMSVLSGMGNRLFYELRDRQHLCYFTGSFASLLRAGGVVGAYIGTRPENETQAIDGLLSELERIRHEPPTDEEMMRAKNTIAGGYVIDLQRRAARASLLAQDEVSGLGYEEALGYLDRIRTVTAGEVRDVAARWFQLQSTTLTILKPPAA